MKQDTRRTAWRLALLVPISMVFGIIGSFLVGENTGRPLLALLWGELGIPLIVAVMDGLFATLVKWRPPEKFFSAFLLTWFACIVASGTAIGGIRVLLG